MQQVPMFCGKDCGGDACPLIAEIEDGRVRRVFNNPAGGKTLKGCRRGLSLPDFQYAPDRLVKPLIRVGERGAGQFREATWDEALSLTADRLGEIRAKYGLQSVFNLAHLGSNGALHNTILLAARFHNLFGGCAVMQGSYSNGAARFALPYMLGDCGAAASGWDSATMQDSEMIILWGANVIDVRLGTDVTVHLLDAKRRGATIVVVDPRRSATVKQADWHLPVRPGSDAALMLAVLYVLFSEGLADRSFIEAHSFGFEQLEHYVLGQNGGQTAHTPQWAAPLCGIPADEIVRFAHAYAVAKPAMLFPGFSIQRVFAGEESYRLSVALQIATGNFGQRGGSTGSMNNSLPRPLVGKMDVLAGPQLAHVPTLRWPDAILEGRGGGYPADIHAIYSTGGNLLNQGSDIRKNIRAFEKIEFVVSQEMFLTPTARWCDVVLPAAGPLEKEDIGLPWMGNYLLYKPQAVARRGQVRSDYEIFCDLAERLGFGEAFSEGRSESEWIQRFLDESEIIDQEDFRRTGIYLAPDQERVGLADFAADPVGYPLDTPSGKVEIANQRYADDTGLPAYPTWQPQPDDERYPLRLLTPKLAEMTHSQGSNIAALRAAFSHRLEMHPDDAADRGICDGQTICVYNDNGTVQVRVLLTEDIMPGVVCLPEGIWFELDEDGVDQAGSANILTSTTGTVASKAPIMHGVGVEVRAAERDK
jgi:anaerobic dimethyl sulfoxide reductase subunit A